jgi:hypothetical protein
MVFVLLDRFVTPMIVMSQAFPDEVIENVPAARFIAYLISVPE